MIANSNKSCSVLDQSSRKKTEDTANHLVDQNDPNSSVVWSYLGYLKPDKAQRSDTAINVERMNTTNLFYHQNQRCSLEQQEVKLYNRRREPQPLPENSACKAATTTQGRFL
ncbi:hypothetical protein AMECASPLE_031986 [Ameca splendens]|uniref:Uncharacterized protein n=1 Tax=Ameca splendens TaxID=208324 RepID=A0ABV0YU73_9TELE